MTQTTDSAPGGLVRRAIMGFTRPGSTWPSFGAWIEAIPRRRLVVFGLIFYAVVSFLRTPQVFLTPRFWSEEGPIYLDFALVNDFWTVMTKAHLGYYSIIPTVGGWLAAQVPFLYAPYVTTTIASAGQLFIFALLLVAPFKEVQTNGARILLAAAWILGFPQTEIWLSTINLQWYLIVATGIVLAAEAKRGAYEKMALGTLFVAGLSGPGSVFLTPLFFLRAVMERSPERIRQAAVIIAVATFQTACVYFNFEEAGAWADQKRSTTIEPYALALASVYRSFFVVLAGPDVGHDFGAIARNGMTLVWPLERRGVEFPEMVAFLGQSYEPKVLIEHIFKAALLAASLVIFFVFFKLGGLKTRFLIAASLFYSVLVSFGALGDGTMISQVSTHAPRYLYPAATLTGLAICLAALRPEASRLSLGVFRSALLIYLFWGLLCFIFGHYLLFSIDWRNGMPWDTAIAIWLSGQTEGIELWPQVWLYQPSLSPEELGLVE